jgi:hypothetical protein
MIASMEKLKSETIENLLAAQGVALAAGRAERLAPGVNALNVADPLRAQLPFEVDPTTYMLAQERTR